MQPCDVGLFGPLKREWRNSVKEYQIAHLGDFVTKQIFAEVFKSAWENATTVESAIKGFKNSDYVMNLFVVFVSCRSTKMSVMNVLTDMWVTIVSTEVRIHA
jgi:hypothetical protein